MSTEPGRFEIEPSDMLLFPDAPPGFIAPIMCGNGHVWSPQHVCGKRKKRLKRERAARSVLGSPNPEKENTE